MWGKGSGKGIGSCLCGYRQVRDACKGAARIVGFGVLDDFGQFRGVLLKVGYTLSPKP